MYSSALPATGGIGTLGLLAYFGGQAAIFLMIAFFILAVALAVYRIIPKKES